MVGMADIDVLPVIDLQGQGGELLHQLRQVGGGHVGQTGLLQHPAGLEVVDGRPVGQHRRGVHGDNRSVGGEGAVGTAGGDREIAPLPDQIPDGLQVALRNAQVIVVQRVVKVAGK